MTQTNRLHSECYGDGPDVVMVHGWAMHTGVWRDFALQLANEHYRVTCLDLPGHGQSPMIDDCSVAEQCRALLDAAPEQARWIGWSLGATLVIHLARCFPERVNGIVLLAGNPRFTRTGDWPTGLDPALLDAMALNLTQDFGAAMQRFLGLQTAGLPGAKRLFKKVRQRLMECEPADHNALIAGLEILKTADMRHALRQLSCPALVLLGAKDTLVPVQSGEAVRGLCPGAQLHVVEGAGHMPFLSAPEETLCRLLECFHHES